MARKYPGQLLIPNPVNPRERIAINRFVGVEPPEDEKGPLYPEIEAFFAQLPRLGIPIVMFQPVRGARSSTTGERQPRPYSLEHARHLVQRARTKANLPERVTLAACRHGGRTELGDAGFDRAADHVAVSARNTRSCPRVRLAHGASARCCCT
jgi:hypothetical protein